MSGPSNLEYLRTAKRTASLTPQQERDCDHMLIGILSVRLSEQVWQDVVDTAIRMVTKPKTREYHGVDGQPKR